MRIATIIISCAVAAMGQGVTFPGGGGSTGTANTWTSANTFRDSIRINTLTGTPGVGKIVIDPRTIPVWTGATAYNVGDIVMATPWAEIADYGATNANAFTYARFECTTAGTSHASTPPVFPGVGATVADGTVVWTGRAGQRRIFEIWAPDASGRTTGVPSTWFDANGGLRSYRSIVLGGTSNGMTLTSEDFTLWPPMVPNTGNFGGSWVGIVPDGETQNGIGFNAWAAPTTCWAFSIVNGTPLIPASQTHLFAIGRYGGLFWTGTSGGHALTSTQPDSDTGFGAILQGDASSRTVIQGVGANSASSVSGATAGGAQTVARGIYQKLAMTDNTATDVARVTIPNVEASATVVFTLLSRAADGESTESHTGVITFNRKAAGSNVVGVVGTLASGPAEAADGAQPIATTVTLQDNGEAAGATQTFDIQITVNTNNSAAAECTFLFDLINHQTGGATIAPL